MLAVDIPSGVDGSHRRGVPGVPPHAAATVTFAALKPGLLCRDGPAYAGQVVVADIGFDISVGPRPPGGDEDVAAWVPGRYPRAHKWRHAVWVVAGSPGMTGRGAAVRRRRVPRSARATCACTVPGDDVRAVRWRPWWWRARPTTGPARWWRGPTGSRWWPSDPGLGRGEGVRSEVGGLLAGVDRPVVVDGDALWVLGPGRPTVLASRSAPTVLTPHDGEFDA